MSSGLDGWTMVIFLMACVSQKVLIVQKFGVLASLPEAVEAEVEVELDHLFAWGEKHSVSSLSEGNQPETLESIFFHLLFVLLCFQTRLSKRWNGNGST